MSSDALLDPLVLLEAVRGDDGLVRDFVYRELNQATCDYLGLSREELLGHGLLEMWPGVEESGLFARYVECLDTGQPVIANDLPYDNEVLDANRRYDLQATRATPTTIILTWRDVTDRYLTLQRVMVSEEQYRLLAENSSDAVVHARDGRVVWASPSIEQVLGGPPESWVGRELLEAVPPEDRAAHRRRMSVLDAGKEFQGRLQLIGRDGVPRWIHAHARPFYDAQGRLDGHAAALRRIDDEVADEQALEAIRLEKAEADARYRDLIKNSIVPAAMVGPDGRYALVNPAMCQFLGYDEATLIGMTPAAVTAPEDLEAGAQGLADLIAGRTSSYRATKQYLHADGHRLWGELSLSCIRTPDGQVENLVVQVLDITEQVQTQQRLAESEAQNRALADKLTAEMSSAAEYVKSILPDDLQGDVEVTSRYLPALELGGDGFHYRWLDDDHFKVYLLDVSGHGIRPALLSASVHNLLRSGSLPLSTLLHPDQVLNQLNALFQMEEQDETYFTIWYGVYQASTRTLSYASAGHPPALALTREGGTVSVTPLSTPSTPIGMFHDTTYTATSYPVPPGGQLLVYSDGAYEISDAAKTEYVMSDNDFTNLCATLAAHRDWSLDTLIDHLKAISPHGAFDDDCALVLLTFPAS